jgi:hypothetical protein
VKELAGAHNTDWRIQILEVQFGKLKREGYLEESSILWKIILKLTFNE